MAIVALGLTACSPSRAGILDFLDQPALTRTATDEKLNPAPVLQPGQAPNYRAIVQQWGPAVVGVTVEGSHKITLDESPAPDWGNDPEVEGAAARAGIQPGDILVGIDGHPAHSVDQVRSVVRGHPKTVALLIERDGQRIFVPVQLG